jgi:diacylglycerol kinase
MNRGKLKKSFGYAVRGIGLVFRSEQNFRIQVSVGIFALFLGLFLGISALKFIFLASVITLVLVLECLNTAVEYIADMLKPRLSDHVKMVKDIMAGAVLLASLLSIIIGIWIFL